MNQEMIQITNTKTFEITDMKSDEDNDTVTISGYANTKGTPDAYGHIPTSMNGEPVYDLSRYKRNPVLLVDHYNSSAYIAGKMVEIVEDDKGLRFIAQLMKNPQNPVVAHAIEAYKQKLGRGISIGGIWEFGDKKNPMHLTKARIHEISLVPVGADERALTKQHQNLTLEATKGQEPEGADRVTDDVKRKVRNEVKKLYKEFDHEKSKSICI